MRGSPGSVFPRAGLVQADVLFEMVQVADTELLKDRLHPWKHSIRGCVTSKPIWKSTRYGRPSSPTMMFSRLWRST